MSGRAVGPGTYRVKFLHWVGLSGFAYNELFYGDGTINSLTDDENPVANPAHPSPLTKEP